MLIAILILTIVNISLTLIAIAGIDNFKTDVQKSVAAAARHTRVHRERDYSSIQNGLHKAEGAE